MQTTHNVRIQRSANPVLDRLLEQGELLPVADKVPGTTGPVYEVDDPERLVILDHFTIRLAGEVIEANLFALPPEEYAGVLLASPEFTQYPVRHLITDLKRPLTPEEQAAWVGNLAESLQTLPRVDQAPRLVLDRVQPALWRPEGTRLSRNSGGWIMTLTFDMPPVPHLTGMDRSAAGIDVGLRNLAVTAYASGAVHRAHGICDLRLGDFDLRDFGVDPAELERHALMLQHAAARDQYHQVVQSLLTNASVVYVEDLCYKEMAGSFKCRSRTLGLRDFMMSWLPQRLHAQDIPLMRLKPNHTSQICALTHLRGERDGPVFRDGNGHLTDANLNAARNILHLGLASRLRGAS